ncbi:MAG: hypothetical protein WC707_02940 [Candidatus Babeliaceae bacterium]|jgi:hypothetical protein
MNIKYLMMSLIVFCVTFSPMIRANDDNNVAAKLITVLMLGCGIGMLGEGVKASFARSQLRKRGLMSLSEALTYKGEKIVYMGIGSHSRHDDWQAYPTFMKNFAETYPGECKCINIDPFYKNITQGIEYTTFGKAIKNGIKEQVTFATVGEKIKPENNAGLSSYLQKVVNGGGVIMMNNCVGPTDAHHVMRVYNACKEKHPDRIQLYMYINDGSYYQKLNGNKYFYYDHVLFTTRFNVRGKIKADEMACVDVVQKKYQEALFAKQNITLFKKYEPQEYKEYIAQDCYKLSPEQIEEDVWSKDISYTFVPKLKLKFKITSAADGRYSVESSDEPDDKALDMQTQLQNPQKYFAEKKFN